MPDPSSPNEPQVAFLRFYEGGEHAHVLGPDIEAMDVDELDTEIGHLGDTFALAGFRHLASAAGCDTAQEAVRRTDAVARAFDAAAHALSGPTVGSDPEGLVSTAVAEVGGLGDTYVLAVRRELAPDEGCDGPSEAARRMEVVARQFREVTTAIEVGFGVHAPAVPTP